MQSLVFNQGECYPRLRRKREAYKLSQQWDATSYPLNIYHDAYYTIYFWCCAEYLDIQADSAARIVADITAPGGKANALLLQKNNLFPLSVATSLILPIKKEYTHTKSKNTLINLIPYWEHIDGE